MHAASLLLRSSQMLPATTHRIPLQSCRQCREQVLPRPLQQKRHLLEAPVKLWSEGLGFPLTSLALL